MFCGGVSLQVVNRELIDCNFIYFHLSESLKKTIRFHNVYSIQKGIHVKEICEVFGVCLQS